MAPLPSRKPRRDAPTGSSSLAALARSARRSGPVSSDRQSTQVTKPTTTGSRSSASVPCSWPTASPPNTAITPNTTTGAHQERAASRPAYAKSAQEPIRITVTRKGLSWWPRTWIARSASRPGVRRMTSSAIATTGEDRMVIAIATKKLVARPAMPATRPATLHAHRLVLTGPIVSQA